MVDDRNRSRTLAAVAIACVCFCVVPTARAHHIRGIPHYTYSENYPEAPSFEEVREVGSFTLRMTYYEIPGTKTADLAVYAKDRRTGKAYTGDLSYAVYALDEDPAAAHTVTAFRNKNNIYKAGWDYETDGIYMVRVRFTDAGQPVDEIFRLQIGSSQVNYWFLGGLGVGLAVLIATVAILKRIRSAPALTAETSGEDA
jgi:hypothetical protein